MRELQPFAGRGTSSLEGERMMGETRDDFALSRRGVLILSAGAAVWNVSRLYGVSSDFWNKKEPSQWSAEEIQQLTTKSPWAKETTAQYSPEQGNGGGMGGPGGGGGGMGGRGGMGRGRSRGGGQRSGSIKGTVRWDSSQRTKRSRSPRRLG